PDRVRSWDLALLCSRAEEIGGKVLDGRGRDYRRRRGDFVSNEEVSVRAVLWRLVPFEDGRGRARIPARCGYAALHEVHDPLLRRRQIVDPDLGGMRAGKLSRGWGLLSGVGEPPQHDSQGNQAAMEDGEEVLLLFVAKD